MIIYLATDKSVSMLYNTIGYIISIGFILDRIIKTDEPKSDDIKANTCYKLKSYFFPILNCDL